MSGVTAAEVRAFVLEFLDGPLRDAGLDPDRVPDALDLHGGGVIDSLGLIEVIAAVEERFGLEVDFETLDPSQLTVLGAFARFIAAESATTAPRS